MRGLKEKELKEYTKIVANILKHKVWMLNIYNSDSIQFQLVDAVGINTTKVRNNIFPFCRTKHHIENTSIYIKLDDIKSISILTSNLSDHSYKTTLVQISSQLLSSNLPTDLAEAYIATILSTV